MDIPAYISIGAFCLQLSYNVYKLGRMSAKVDNTADVVENLSKELHNGFTCKHHAEITQEIGKLEGAADKNN